MFPDSKTSCLSPNSSHNFSNLYSVITGFMCHKESNLISSKINFMYKLSLVESKKIRKFSETPKSQWRQYPVSHPEVHF